MPIRTRHEFRRPTGPCDHTHPPDACRAAPRHVGLTCATLAVAGLLLGGCEWLEPESAGASASAEEAVAEAREVTASIASVRDQYRRAPAAGLRDDGEQAGPRAISPSPPPFQLRPRYDRAGSQASCADLFGGRVPVEVLPPEYIMPEDVYWSFAIYLELRRPGEAFDLLDEATQRAVRPHLINRFQSYGQPGDGPTALPTRELWAHVMNGTTPSHIEIVSLRTAMTPSVANVIITPLDGDEISVRFVLGPDGWRMNLVPFLGDGQLLPTWSTR